jgi:alkanesulfonate monooxygenase SsuD/methylene tetrahydromethanopterin reductase-like flavin-dependent oxidoreductase (luciferase family)
MADLAVHLGGHHRDWDAVLALVRRAEALGYRAAYLDGDVSIVPSRGEGAVSHGWTATVAALARTERIEIGSIRLAHHWNAAQLAQAVATAEQVAPGRLRFLVSLGAHPIDRRFGLIYGTAAERAARLDELLGVLRRLWSGERVTFDGRFVQLEDAVVRPIVRIPIEVGGGPRRAALVARHADRWDVNVPPLDTAIRDAQDQLAKACAPLGRDPAAIGRSVWILARPGRPAGDAAVRAEFRRWQPWFRGLTDAQADAAVLAGPVAACRARIAAIRSDLGIDLPVLDLAGLAQSEAEDAMEKLAGA